MSSRKANDFRQANEILAMYPTIEQEELSWLISAGKVRSTKDPRHPNWRLASIGDVGRWVERKKNARGIDELRYTDKRGRECIAIKLIPKEFGVSLGTFRRWLKDGCMLLGWEKPDCWEEHVVGASDRKYTFVSFLNRHRKARQEAEERGTGPVIPDGYVTYKTAKISRHEFARAVREQPRGTDFAAAPAKNGRTSRTRIVPVGALNRRDPSKFEYPGLTPAWKTGIKKPTIEYLVAAGHLTSVKKPGIDAQGRLWKDLVHLKEAELPAIKRRLSRGSEREGKTINGRIYYSSPEALRIANRGVPTERQIFHSQLWYWRPKNIGGFGKLCPRFNPPRVLDSVPDDEPGYRSRHKNDGETSLYAGDDMALLNAWARGLDAGSITTVASTLHAKVHQPILTDREEELLQALFELKAFDYASRRTTDEAANRARPGQSQGNFKKPARHLVKLKLVESKDAAQGGIWLSIDGRKREETLKESGSDL